LKIKSHIMTEAEEFFFFNKNITGLLLYRKLGYVPYEVEKRYDRNSTPVALIKLKKELRQFTVE